MRVRWRGSHLPGRGSSCGSVLGPATQSADQRQREQHEDQDRRDREHVEAVLDRDGRGHPGEDLDHEGEAADQQRGAHGRGPLVSPIVHRVRRFDRPLAKPVGEQLDRRESEDEAADVREVGDSAVAGEVGDRGLADGRHELEQEPDSEHHVRRHLDQGDEEDDEDEGQHPRLWVQQRVAAQHPGHRPAGADRPDRRPGVEQRLRVDGDQPGQQVEEDEAGPAHRVLDVVAENPQEQHVLRPGGRSPRA